MLKLHFFNVAEGDSILVECIEPSRTFRLLIDAGREHLDELPPCATCVEHLRALGITSIDMALITHLHVDHVGGLKAVLDEIPVRTLLCGYMPLSAGSLAHATPKTERVVRGLIECLNLWSNAVHTAKQRKTSLRELFASWRNVRLTKDLTADFIVPNVEASRLQRRVFNAMLGEVELPQEQKVRAARLRNPNSLRVRLHYAGREIELAGDCYGEVWEKDDVAPCDLLKVPHHGDRKSMTRLLTEKLHPMHAVICCSSRYLPRKDRPSSQVIRMLRRSGAQLWFTDAYAEGKRPARATDDTVFLILEDGTIIPPEEVHAPRG